LERNTPRVPVGVARTEQRISLAVSHGVDRDGSRRESPVGIEQAAGYGLALPFTAPAFAGGRRLPSVLLCYRGPPRRSACSRAIPICNL